MLYQSASRCVLLLCCLSLTLSVNIISKKDLQSPVFSYSFYPMKFNKTYLRKPLSLSFAPDLEKALRLEAAALRLPLSRYVEMVLTGVLTRGYILTGINNQISSMV